MVYMRRDHTGAVDLRAIQTCFPSKLLDAFVWSCDATPSVTGNGSTNVERPRRKAFEPWPSSVLVFHADAMVCIGTTNNPLEKEA